MKSEWKDYLTSIGLRPVLLSRAETIIDFYSGILEIDPEYLFVSEYQGNDGSRQYESLWLCSSRFFCEAKNFTAEYDCDYVPYDGNFAQWSVLYKDFDWRDATEESRLTLDFLLNNDVYGKLQATGFNCNQLVKFLDLYIKPFVRDSR